MAADLISMPCKLKAASISWNALPTSTKTSLTSVSEISSNPHLRMESSNRRVESKSAVIAIGTSGMAGALRMKV